MQQQFLLLPFFFLVFNVLLALALDPCLNFKNCYECLYNDQDCGWCGSLGMCLTGTLQGPSNSICLMKMNTTSGNRSMESSWEFTYSHIMSNSSDPGNKLSPSQVTIFLRPGKMLPIRVKLRIPIIPPIDFFFLLDASISMFPYITLIQTMMPQINGNLTAVVQEARLQVNDTTPATVYFGLGSYIEKPVSPFACYPEAYILKVHTGLVNTSEEMQTALGKLLQRLAINYEHPENPLEAALLASFDNSDNYTPKINWRPGSFHIVMICTDASAHVAGQGQTLGIFKPNNHDGIPDGDPPGSGEDYPDKQEWKKKLIDNNVTPLFGVIETSGVIGFYQSLVNETMGSWVAISNNSQQVVEAILQGTKDILSRVSLSNQLDPLNRLDSIVPLLYQNATPNSYVYFTLNFLQSLTDTQYFGLTNITVVRYVGFSDAVTVTSITAIDCTGCAVNDKSYQIDLCDTCGGNNSVCMGCDGTLKGPKLDVCGVCGGANETCLDCLGHPVAPGKNGTDYDLCGVCGGDNTTCRGCDNIPNSGAVYNNCKPPVCGGPPCDDTIVAVVVLASLLVVGVVFAGVACLMLFGAGAAMMVADEELIEKEANLHDNPLYEEAKRKFDNPLYGAT